MTCARLMKLARCCPAPSVGLREGTGEAVRAFSSREAWRQYIDWLQPSQTWLCIVFGELVMSTGRAISCNTTVRRCRSRSLKFKWAHGRSGSSTGLAQVPRSKYRYTFRYLRSARPQVSKTRSASPRVGGYTLAFACTGPTIDFTRLTASHLTHSPAHPSSATAALDETRGLRRTKAGEPRTIQISGSSLSLGSFCWPG